MNDLASEVLAPVITVDGPSGVGKGTLCQGLAVHLGWPLLDSGVLYRLTALAALRQGLSLADEQRLATVAAELDAAFVAAPDGTTLILLNGVDTGSELRTETCAAAASQVAAWPMVRAALLQRQRHFRQLPGLIADGRDMGTVVFPDAQLKLFLTASSEARAQRRYNQLREKGMDVNLENLVEEINARDMRDTHRTVAPLEPASDARVVDTTSLGVADVFNWALAFVAERFPDAANPSRDVSHR